MTAFYTKSFITISVILVFVVLAKLNHPLFDQPFSKNIKTAYNLLISTTHEKSYDLVRFNEETWFTLPKPNCTSNEEFRICSKDINEIHNCGCNITNTTKFHQSHDRKWNIQNTNILNSPKCSNLKSVTYYVKSHYVLGFSRREKIRESWGNDKNVVFICFSKNATKVPEDSNAKDLLVTNDYPEEIDYFSVKIALGIQGRRKLHTFHKKHIFQKPKITKNMGWTKIVIRTSCDDRFVVRDK